MTNVFGSAPPPVQATFTDDLGHLQLAHIFTSAVPAVVTHVRYYVASTSLAAEVSGTAPVQVWLLGDPDTVVTETLTIPAVIGWVDVELTTPLNAPSGRQIVVAVSLDDSPQSYGLIYNTLPVAAGVLTCVGSTFAYQTDPLSTTNAYTLPTGALRTSYLIDLEVSVSELIIPDPLDLAADDVIEINSHVRGVVNTVTPITDALTVNITVEGGPLDGTDVDYWVPDTAEGLAAADMQLYQEVDDPAVPSLHQNTADDSIWSYIGGGVYLCVVAGSSFAVLSQTTRAETPTLTEYP